MTDKQFWMKADQIADSGKTIEEKGKAMAALLKIAYNENLHLVILLMEFKHTMGIAEGGSTCLIISPLPR